MLVASLAQQVTVLLPKGGGGDPDGDWVPGAGGARLGRPWAQSSDGPVAWWPTEGVVVQPWPWPLENPGCVGRFGLGRGLHHAATLEIEGSLGK
ncbi:hypothetical protein NDU88_002919 [Pleurodeles waltl]|uniref:Secreted protein n=1 Tax=Pleurodeles waltl TaxID=8319 RepID=A0AAV7QBA4_PLEWA|nr:hypothetical protein NDU88_002919 [Pleurodeles waltl]